MEREQAQAIAKSNRSTAKAVLQAAERGVDEYDLEDFFHARNLGTVHLTIEGEEWRIKQTVDQVVGLYQLCGRDTDELMQLAEDIRDHVQAEILTKANAGDLSDSGVCFLNQKDFAWMVNSIRSQYLAERFDSRFDKEAAQLVQSHQVFNIEDGRRMVHDSYGLSHTITRTSIQLDRARRQLFTSVFMDAVNRDKRGLPTDFDLTPAARLINEDLTTAEELYHQYLLRGAEFRIAAELLLDPELPFANDINGDNFTSNLGFTDETRVALGNITVRMRRYLGLLVPGVMVSRRMATRALRDYRKSDSEEVEDPTEQELTELAKANFIKLSDELKHFVATDDGMQLQYPEPTEKKHAGRVYSTSVRALKKRFEEGATDAMYNRIGRTGIAIVIASFAPMYPFDTGYEIVCHKFGITLDSQLHQKYDSFSSDPMDEADDMILDQPPLSVDVISMWKIALREHKKQQELALAAARLSVKILSGQRTEPAE